MAKEVVGRWTDVPGSFSNVPVHASLLPNRKILYWGRRSDPKKTTGTTLMRFMNNVNLDEHVTRAFVWDPSDGSHVATKNEPLDADGKPVSLFCSGHCLTQDGNVLIVGGHITDGAGANQACVYDTVNNVFVPQTRMFAGRWYPSALPLPDGRVLVISGSEQGFRPNNIAQVWSGGIPKTNTWTEVQDPFSKPNAALNLFPRVHLSPTGRVFMAGPQVGSWWLDFTDSNGEIKTAKGVVGDWKDAKTARAEKFRDYAPSVLYDKGKIMYIGGGSEDPGPTNNSEFIDLNQNTPVWSESATDNMVNSRKQFNATILSDGTVLVTGGTSGPGFNNLGASVKQAELWDPSAPGKKWSLMAAESTDRCYHSIALLMPDGRVLSAGGGEYGDCTPNDCHMNAQMFEPPCLFKGTRPTILTAPTEINYGATISLTVRSTDVIGKVSWLRLGSVTHCRNMNQLFLSLENVKQTGSNVTVSAPANANLAPPGHYMLFVLNKQGAPCESAAIIRISKTSTGPSQLSARIADSGAPTGVAKHVQPSQVQPTLQQHDDRIAMEQAKVRSPVVIGLTPLCPYGLGPCWGGAFEGLHNLRNVDIVRPLPDHTNSLAYVYLKQDILPDVDAWRKDLEQMVHRAYDVRGIEMTVTGVATKNQVDGKDQVTLAGASPRAQLTLTPFLKSSQLKWDVKEKSARPVEPKELGAYDELLAKLASHPDGVTLKVTGTLQKDSAGDFSIEVRDSGPPDTATS